MVGLVEEHRGLAPALLLVTPVGELRFDRERKGSQSRAAHEIERPTRLALAVFETFSRHATFPFELDYTVLPWVTPENGLRPGVARMRVCACLSTAGLAEPPSGSPQTSETSAP